MSETLENLVVVLVRTRNPLNLGAVARAMSNFGSVELRTVEPFEKAWREARSAVGAGAVMEGAKEFATISEAVADCTLVVGTTSVGNRELKHPLYDLVEAAPMLRERMHTGRAAVLFGSEKFGLSNEELSFCHWLLRIPTRGEHRSMNLGQAAAVVLYEIGRKGSGGGKGSKGFEEVRGEMGGVVDNAKRPNAEAQRVRSEEKKRSKEMGKGRRKSSHGEEESGLKDQRYMEEGRRAFAEMEVVERVGEALLEALVKSGYVGPRSRELAEEKLRRMLRRFSMEAADAEVFLGMMRKILEVIEVKK